MKFKLGKYQILLILILFLALGIRVVGITTTPPHLTPDEAALGYNAYSILKTGKDEFGKKLPIIFKSFGDYKPGLYVYASVPFVFTFGLNEFSTRAASIFGGVIAVWLVYLVVKKLFSDRNLALVAAGLLAISPWHINFSRGAWEVNLALTFLLAGVYFFFLSLDKQKYLLASAFFFGLTLLTYQGAKLSSGLVLILLVGLYAKKIIAFKKQIVVGALLVGLIVSLPSLKTMFTQESGRLKVFSIFSYPRPKDYLQKFLDQGNEKIGGPGYYIFHSETQSFTRGLVGRYFNYFSAKFLFLYGDWQNPKHSAPNHGMFLIADMVLFVAGIVSLLKHKLSKPTAFVWLWLFLAPLPAVLSRDQIHGVRSLNMVIPMVLINAFGFMLIFNKLKNGTKNRLIGGGLLVIYLLSFVYFLDAYFIHLAKHNSMYWDYGYKQIVETVTPIQHNYKMVRVQQSYAQPYIYFLFYQKYDPAKYQAQNNWIPSEVAYDVGKVEHLDNIYFGPIDWSVNRGDKDTLFVADTIRIPPVDSSDPMHFRIINEIKYLDNIHTAFRILDVIR